MEVDDLNNSISNKDDNILNGLESKTDDESVDNSDEDDDDESGLHKSSSSNDNDTWSIWKPAVDDDISKSNSSIKIKNSEIKIKPSDSSKVLKK